ncbi:MAG: hypothetical protein JXA90_02295 [Planctomycetes bacterium]|nr:hypothetical protein [Planctomycetota bacterium]
MFDEGAEFLFQTSEIVTASSLKYNLSEEYFGRFGVSTEWAKALLESEAAAGSSQDERVRGPETGHLESPAHRPRPRGSDPLWTHGQRSRASSSSRTGSSS